MPLRRKRERRGDHRHTPGSGNSPLVSISEESADENASQLPRCAFGDCTRPIFLGVGDIMHDFWSVLCVVFSGVVRVCAQCGLYARPNNNARVRVDFLWCECMYRCIFGFRCWGVCVFVSFCAFCVGHVVAWSYASSTASNGRACSVHFSVCSAQALAPPPLTRIYASSTDVLSNVCRAFEQRANSCARGTCTEGPAAGCTTWLLPHMPAARLRAPRLCRPQDRPRARVLQPGSRAKGYPAEFAPGACSKCSRQTPARCRRSCWGRARCIRRLLVPRMRQAEVH